MTQTMRETQLSLAERLDKIERFLHEKWSDAMYAHGINSGEFKAGQAQCERVSRIKQKLFDRENNRPPFMRQPQISKPYAPK